MDGPWGSSLFLDIEGGRRSQRHEGGYEIISSGCTLGGAETGGRRGEMLPAGRERVLSSTFCHIRQWSKCHVCFPFYKQLEIRSPCQASKDRELPETK